MPSKSCTEESRSNRFQSLSLVGEIPAGFLRGEAIQTWLKKLMILWCTSLRNHNLCHNWNLNSPSWTTEWPQLAQHLVPAQHAVRQRDLLWRARQSAAPGGVTRLDLSTILAQKMAEIHTVVQCCTCIEIWREILDKIRLDKTRWYWFGYFFFLQWSSHESYPAQLFNGAHGCSYCW